MPTKARRGWTGANHRTAPLAPRASSAILLQAGQPTARNERKPPRAPDFAVASVGEATYVAVIRPDKSEVISNTGHAHQVGATVLPNHGFGIKTVGTPTRRTVTPLASPATRQR
jgi:hypothetical protein